MPVSEKDILELERIRDSPRVLGPLDITLLMADFVLKMDSLFGDDGLVVKVLEEKYGLERRE